MTLKVEEMSKDASSSSLRSASRSNLKPTESNENDFHNLFTQFPFPPPRTPLNSIADPSQLHQGPHPSTLNKSESRRASHRKYDTPDSHIGNGVRGKAHSEPNSAQSTPVRRISNVFTPGTCSGVRHALHKVTTLSSRTSKGASVINSEPSVQVPHFELADDPSFWKDHNVQVLFRNYVNYIKSYVFSIWIVWLPHWLPLWSWLSSN